MPRGAGRRGHRRSHHDSAGDGDGEVPCRCRRGETLRRRGPSVFFFIDEKPGAAATFANRVYLDSQAGLDIPVNKSGMGVSLDAKKYFIGTTAHFMNAGGGEVLTTEHKLDPRVVGGGVYLRI